MEDAEGSVAAEEEVPRAISAGVLATWPGIVSQALQAQAAAVCARFYTCKRWSSKYPCFQHHVASTVTRRSVHHFDKPNPYLLTAISHRDIFLGIVPSHRPRFA